MNSLDRLGHSNAVSQYGLIAYCHQPKRGGGMRPGEKVINNKVIIKMREAHQMIRGYAVIYPEIWYEV